MVCSRRPRAATTHPQPRPRIRCVLPAPAGGQGGPVGAQGGLLAQARGGDPEDPGPAHGVEGDVVLGQLQVGGGGLAVEVQGEVVGREDLAECHRGVELGLGHDVVVVDAQAAHLGAHEPPEGVVADAGDDGRAVAVAGGGDGDVGRAAAQELAEGLHVLQPHPDLERVDVDAAASDGQDVERRGQGGCGHDGLPFHVVGAGPVAGPAPSRCDQRAATPRPRQGFCPNKFDPGGSGRGRATGRAMHV